jgi:hypothetical protein
MNRPLTTLTTLTTSLTFALLLMASKAPAQDNLPQPIAAARRAYSQDETNNTLAQIPRRMGPMGRQGPPMRGPVYQGSGGQESWGPQFSPGHTLIGAAIGFGWGAAVGSKSGVRTSLALGTIVGLVGAAIGAGIPSFPRHYCRRCWDDEEASQRKQKRSRPEVSHHHGATQVAASREEPGETH